MFATSFRVLTVAGALAFATAATAAVKYTGPKLDFSKVQKGFGIGFLGDETSKDILTRNACLKDYVEAAYNVPAKMFTFKDYAGTVESMLGGNLDYAWFGSSGYAGMYLQNPDAVVPVLTRMQPTGDTGNYSVMLARKDSGIKTLADAKGKKLGFADPNSTSGYLIPSIELAEKLGPLDKYFKSTQFMGGHENGVLGLLNKDVDVAVTWVTRVGKWSEGYSSGNLRKMVDKGILNLDDVVQVWSSKLIPNSPIVMPKNCPKRLAK